MGRVVAELADHGILTNDNPRSERPEDIAEAVLPGLSVGPAKYRVLLDRRSAIREAVLSAPPGAVVLLAGKGHEPYQIIGSETLPFDDRIEARAALAERRQERQGQRP
jgi:UDP-N-acetylmuramoyl-L-alanyl-D-glutamate--2,6-diaminopimelate ligase